MKCERFFGNKFTGRSLLLLGIYVLHFALLQGFVAGFSNGDHFSIKSFFSNSQHGHHHNDGIATFRTLEKHECSKQEFKSFTEAPLVHSLLSVLIIPFADKQELSSLSNSPFYLSDASYRLYLKDRVFRI